MGMLDSIKAAKSPEQRLAWMVAIAVDAIQILGMPLFAEGAASPLDTALDIATAGILTKLLGWHWAFLPTLAAELIPGIDLVPTWTAAVFFVTRSRHVESGEAEILPPGPAPSVR
jgi:hypothetical protein